MTAGAPLLTFALARLAALWLVPEILIGEKLLLSRSEHEIGAAVDALEYSILKLWHLPGSCLPVGTALPQEKASLTRPISCQLWLFEIPATLFPVSFSGQRLLDPFPLSRLQVKGVFLHFLNNVLLLDFPLEPAEGVL